MGQELEFVYNDLNIHRVFGAHAQARDRMATNAMQRSPVAENIKTNLSVQTSISRFFFEPSTSTLPVAVSYSLNYLLNSVYKKQAALAKSASIAESFYVKLHQIC